MTLPTPLEQKVTKATGKCCICNKETDMYCPMCAKTWGEFDPTYYCEEHYEKVVLTGNCCSESESVYGGQVC